MEDSVRFGIDCDTFYGLCRSSSRITPRETSPSAAGWPTGCSAIPAPRRSALESHGESCQRPTAGSEAPDPRRVDRRRRRAGRGRRRLGVLPLATSLPSSAQITETSVSRSEVAATANAIPSAPAIGCSPSEVRDSMVSGLLSLRRIRGRGRGQSKSEQEHDRDHCGEYPSRSVRDVWFSWVSPARGSCVHPWALVPTGAITVAIFDVKYGISVSGECE